MKNLASGQRIRTLLFDLDGTLIDSRADLTSADANQTPELVDIIISTDGKFLINSRSTYGDTLQQREFYYADFSQVSSGAAALLYLSDTPATNPVLTIRGAVVFDYSRRDGTPITETNQADRFHLHIEGGIDLQAGNAAKITVEGSLDLSFSSSQFDLQFSGQLKLTALGEEVTLLGAAGALHLDTSGSSIKVWGALAITANLGFLERVGMSANGLQLFTLNITSQDHEDVLDLPGRGPTSVREKANSIGFLVQGTLQFKQAGGDWFLMQGTFAMELSGTDGLSVVASGKLDLRVAGKDLLRFNFDGFLQINSRGVAAMIDVKLAENLPDDYGVSLEITGQASLLLNTTSQTVTYVLPAAVATVPGGGTNRTITVPGGPPGRAFQPYLQIAGVGRMEVLSLELNGSFYLLVAPSVIQMEVTGSMDLRVGGTTLLGFDVVGGFQIDAKGVAAAFALSVRVRLPDSVGASLTASYRLEVNTTNEKVIFRRHADDPGIELEAGPYARIRADGTLTVLQVRLDGYFEITVGPSLLNFTAHAALDLRAGSVSVFSFNVDGGFHLRRL